MEYLFLKWLHIISATILFGTGIGSAFYMFMANRSRDIASIYFATRHVVIADWLFTTPAVIVQLITGLWLVHVGDYEYTTAWVLRGLILFFFCRSMLATSRMDANKNAEYGKSRTRQWQGLAQQLLEHG